MTVKELRELLAQYPDSIPIAYSCCSEYKDLEASEIATGELFNNGGYCSRPYQVKDRALLRTYLLFPGN
jgi:hypothetical protein